VISVDHLSKRYGSITAVDDLSFEVREGEVLGLLGPNGAGKTTTLRMITGFLPPSRGRVRIGGFDLYDHPIEAKRKLGYLPEQPPLHPEMTVRRYLRFVAALKDVPASRTAAAVGLAIERARLGDVADARIRTLSKGYRQRVGLAQAIVHEPPVLILDEPTSSLDPKQRAEVRELIVGLKGRHTVILSTHILPEVSEVADRVVILHRGKVMAVDTPEKLGAQLRARETVRVTIAGTAGATGPATGDVKDALSRLAGAVAVDVAVGAGGTIEARVESARGTDLRADAASLVVARGWRLVGLAGESLSLEDVFLELTGDEKGGA
jgi:ABC-2 type transport system ATP-binding protein